MRRIASLEHSRRRRAGPQRAGPRLDQRQQAPLDSRRRPGSTCISAAHHTYSPTMAQRQLRNPGQDIEHLLKGDRAMSKRIFSEHIEQIWNNKDASGIERFIAPNYRGFDGAEV